MKQKLLTTLQNTWPKLVWIAGSAALTAVITYLLQQPEWLPYYGVLNLVLVFVNEFRKA